MWVGFELEDSEKPPKIWAAFPLYAEATPFLP
jgi:hypothetical protein